MLLTPQTNIILDINILHLGESEFATIQNIPAVAQIQNAMRDARMQMYKAASASGGFANVDLNPTTDNKSNGDQDHQREKQISPTTRLPVR
jgi:hypothetical protein